MTDIRRITPDRLAAFATATLVAAGTTADQATATTRAMMHASIHGVDSHGIRLLPYYLDSLNSGLAKSRPAVTVSRPRAAAAEVDAGGGLGHLPTYRAMEEACAIAAEAGIGMAVVRHSTHFGAAGAYTMAAAEKGFIGFATCNSGRIVAAFHGAEAFHGTNPISLCAPVKGRDPFLLDMATSSIPWNRVLQFRTEARELPAAVALDGEGKFTRDPEAARMLAPLGGEIYGYKGAGLAGLADVLSAVLTGMHLSHEEEGTSLAFSEIGHFVLAIDPTTFIGRALYESRLTDYLTAIAAQSRGERVVMAAGGPQWAFRDDRLKNGIPLTVEIRNALEAAGKSLGIMMD